jgi:hypothetical protein
MVDGRLILGAVVADLVVIDPLGWGESSGAIAAGNIV